MFTHDNCEGLVQTNFGVSAALLGARADVDPAASVLAPQSHRRTLLRSTRGLCLLVALNKG